jgi:hypothetical protein
VTSVVGVGLAEGDASGPGVVSGEATDVAVGVTATSEWLEVAVGAVEPQAARPTATTMNAANRTEVRRRTGANVNDMFTFG